MWSALSFVLITVICETSCGYTSGAPCNERNTILLETNGFWRYPRDRVQCVDITSLGDRTPVPDFQGLHDATTLYADYMCLEDIPRFFVHKMRSVKLIDFSGNSLRKLAKDEILPLKHLQILLLSDNRIVIPKTPLLNSRSLTTLSLSNNKIRKLNAGTFCELKKLTTLYLDSNLLTHVDAKMFLGLKDLKYLHLGNNRLKLLPNIVMRNPKAVLILKGNPFNNTGVIKRKTL